jgi:gas vesicle protein
MPRYEFDEDQPYVVIERHTESVGPFLLGIALGAGVALLLAPRSGAATRRDIRRRALRVRRAAENVATEVTDTVVDTFQDARRRVEDQIDSARQVIDLKRQQVQRAMDAGRAAAQEAREELEQRIAESKAAYRADQPGRTGGTVARAGQAAVAIDETDGG